MAGEFYTLGRMKIRELKVMQLEPIVSDRIKDHGRRVKSIPKMILIALSVIAPFVLLVVFSNLLFINPALYLLGTSLATGYFTLFMVANKEFLERRQ